MSTKLTLIEFKCTDGMGHVGDLGSPTWWEPESQIDDSHYCVQCDSDASPTGRSVEVEV